MEYVATEQQMKSAFRVAYDFLEKHRGILRSADEYKSIADDMTGVFVSTEEDPLACRLVCAVYDYVCATSKREAGDKQ